MGKSQLKLSDVVQQDLKTRLKPQEDATHRRDQKTSPPQVVFAPGTRESATKKISNWADSSLTANSHICWVHGPVGSGKSAIAQVMATMFENKGKLAGSFFWSRRSEGRRKSNTLAPTLAYQLANAVPKTAPHIQSVLLDEPDLLNSYISLPTQMDKLVFGPCKSVFKKPMFNMKPLGSTKGPFIFVLDGIDKCQDIQRITDFLAYIVAFFRENPSAPIRLLITGRLTEFLVLHAEVPEILQINLSDASVEADVKTAIQWSFSEAQKALNDAGSAPVSWPSPADISTLEPLANPSFSTADALVKFVVKSPSASHMETLPLTPARLDAFFRSVFRRGKDLPYFMDIISAIALLRTPQSVTDLSNFVGAHPFAVLNVLSRISPVIAVPARDDAPTTFTLHVVGFLADESRSGEFHVQPSILRQAAFHHLDMAIAHFESLTEDAWMLPLDPAINTAARSWPTHLDLVLEADPSFDLSGFDARWSQVLSRIQFVPHFTTLMAILALSKVKYTQMVHICTILQTDLTDLSLIVYALTPLISRRSNNPLITMGDAIGFRHPAIADFLLDPVRSGRLSVEPCQYTFLTQRYMAIVFGVPVSFINDKSYLITWPYLLSRAVLEDPMFERDFVEEQFNPVRAFERAQVDSLQGWKDAITIVLEPEEVATFASNVEAAIQAIERQFPDIFEDVEETFTKVQENKVTVLASRITVAVVDILFGFRTILCNPTDARLCLQRGCGTGLQIERYVRIGGSHRFYISLYRYGSSPNDAAGVGRAVPPLRASRADSYPIPQAPRPPQVRRADTTPLITFEDTQDRGEGSSRRRGEEREAPVASSSRDGYIPAAGSSKTPVLESFPVASSSKLTRDSPPVASSSKIPALQDSPGSADSPKLPQESPYLPSSSKLPEEANPFRDSTESLNPPVRTRTPTRAIEQKKEEQDEEAEQEKKQVEDEQEKKGEEAKEDDSQAKNDGKVKKAEEGVSSSPETSKPTTSEESKVAA